MIKDYDQILPGLERDIINKIVRIEKRSLIIKQIVYSLVSIISFIGIIVSTSKLIQIVTISGTYEYILLILNDIKMLSYWKELFLSIAETIPFLELSIVLGIAGIFFWSIRKTFRLQIFKNALI